MVVTVLIAKSSFSLMIRWLEYAGSSRLKKQVSARGSARSGFLARLALMRNLVYDASNSLSVAGRRSCPAEPNQRPQIALRQSP